MTHKTTLLGHVWFLRPVFPFFSQQHLLAFWGRHCASYHTPLLCQLVLRQALKTKQDQTFLCPRTHNVLSVTMKFASLALAALSLSTVSAWTPRQKQPMSSSEISRRKVLGQSLLTLVATTTTGTLPARAGLLDEFGSDPSKIQQAPAAVVVPTTAAKKAESAIEPNLRSNYYYPTNKKRYLPRIKRCSDAIPDAATFIGNEDWDAAETFALTIADDVRPTRSLRQ